MSYLALLIPGLAGMLVLWILAVWLWRATAAPGAPPVHRGESTAKGFPAPQPQAPTVPMQFRQLQSGTVALFAKEPKGESAPENRVRRNCMMVDAVSGGNASPEVSKIQTGNDEEIERHPTEIYLAESDSPRSRGGHSGQELETRPYKRAYHHMPRAAAEKHD